MPIERDGSDEGSEVVGKALFEHMLRMYGKRVEKPDIDHMTSAEREEYKQRVEDAGLVLRLLAESDEKRRGGTTPENN